MAYGLKVLTQFGVQDIGNVRSGQLIQKSDHTTLNGTVSTPSGFTNVNCFAFAISRDGKPTPALDFGPGNSITWKTTVGGESSIDFSIYVVRHK